MTPEREEYERQRAFTERGMDAARRELQALIDGAPDWGVVLTVTTMAQFPLHMGHVKMIGDVRISRARLNELEALRKAAEKSEEV